MLIELSIEARGAPEGLEALVREVGEACCRVEGVSDLEAGGRIVDDREIRRINGKFRGIDRETDVLSFPSVAYAPGRTAKSSPKRLRREYNHATGKIHIGDFVLCIDRARAQAEAYGHSLKRELGYLTAHSIFHLMGYDHEDEDQRRHMRALEERAMDQINLKRGEDEGMSDQALYERACAALERAYAPYSNFRVGACLLSEDGRAFEGCNIENAAYGAAICAERCAVSAAVAQGARGFTAIAVVGEAEDAWPCGICRQVLSEFSRDLRVICGNVQSGKYTVVPLAELLPHAFGPADLGK